MATTDVDKLLREYIERFESGGSPDPSAFLKQAKGKKRAELSALIEGYLEHAARPQPWEPEQLEGSLAERAVSRLSEQWSEDAGRLPHQLVVLRDERKLKRAELVSKLADAIGASGEREKVARYYHRLERGLLPSESVSSKVYDALAGLLGTTADALRKAGEAVAPSAGGEPGATFARAAPPGAASPGLQADASPGPPRGESLEETPPEEDWDEVDRLFLGG